MEIKLFFLSMSVRDVVVLLAASARFVSSQLMCRTVSADFDFDFTALYSAGSFVGTNPLTNDKLTFTMCQDTLDPLGKSCLVGSDYAALATFALAAQPDSCFTAAEWKPNNIEGYPVWKALATGEGVQMTIPADSKVACPRGGGIVVNFRCDVNQIGSPFTFETEGGVGSCSYVLTFLTSTVCSAPRPLKPGGYSPAAIAGRNFGCGHLSCGWAFTAALALALPLVWVVVLLVNKLVAKKLRGGAVSRTWREALPLSVAPCLIADWVGWGLRFVACNWPCCTRGPVFRRWNCNSSNERVRGTVEGQRKYGGGSFFGSFGGSFSSFGGSRSYTRRGDESGNESAFSSIDSNRSTLYDVDL